MKAERRHLEMEGKERRNDWVSSQKVILGKAG